MSVFSWTGGAHHCVVTRPQQPLHDAPLRAPVAVPVPPPPALDCAAGLSAHLRRINHDRAPIHRDVIAFEGLDGGHRIAVAMQWTTGPGSAVSVVGDGNDGAHRDGFLDAVTAVVNGFARRQRRIAGDGPDLTRADIGAGLTAIVSVRSGGPGAVRNVCTEHLTRRLTHDPVTATTIVHRAIAARIGHDRLRAGQRATVA